MPNRQRAAENTMRFFGELYLKPYERRDSRKRAAANDGKIPKEGRKKCSADQSGCVVRAPVDRRIRNDGGH